MEPIEENEPHHPRYRNHFKKPLWIKIKKYMKPIKFPEQNVIYAENQPEYQPLPAWRNDGGMGEVVSCWQLSFKERLRILFTGKLWVSLCAFGKPLTPSYFTTKKSDVLITNKIK